MRIAVLLATLSCASPALGLDWGWRSEDVAWQATFTALAVADWGQTLDIAGQCRSADPSRYVRETNPLLGRCPTHWDVNTVLPLAIVAHAGISALLPRPYRRYWQVLSVGVEGHSVFTNWRAGFRIRF